MRLGEEVLHGPPEIYAKVVALERVYGTANSYVRKRRAKVTLKAIGGQVASARRAGASESEIRAKIQQGISDPPNVDPVRVKRAERRFLQ